ncbi:MAG: cytidylate kinase-like family protein [Spirochaetaceae bacterium]|nr:cytidylate kinase-like family protein [Spirochaetaceae bacterium]MBO4729559.1 cytidylate kinase-like family protein [Spirochaetaceae bacterium]MBR4824360.1 cytidylate kinase-like family protein [Spirochaetaceae bacterium]
MGKQVIISIGREYGSAGHLIAEKLAAKLNMDLYDRNLLDEVADVKHVDTNNLSKYDEKPHRLFGSRTVRGYSNSPEANVAQLQLALLKSKAADGDSFVIVGRCADDIFRGMENFISIFIYADREARIKRVLERHPQLDEKQAIKKIERHDRNRAAYHNYFAKGGKWGDKANYDLCVNSTRLGLEGTVDFLCKYIEQRLGH